MPKRWVAARMARWCGAWLGAIPRASALGGRFDLFPADLYVGLGIMRRILTPERATRLTWDPQPYNVTAYHLLLNRKNPANPRYLALFNRGLKKLRDSGKYAQYMSQ